MTTGLERIAAKAQSDSRLTFTSLAHHLTPELLFGSLSRIPVNSGSGVDGMDVKTARDTFGGWVEDTLGAVHRGGYRPPPVKRVYIPKPG